MSTYYYISSAYSYKNSIIEDRNFIYYSGYTIFSNIRKLDLSFNLKNKFYELLFKKNINNIINKFIDSTSHNDIFIFSANGYDIFSLLLQHRLLYLKRKVIVRQLDPVRECLKLTDCLHLLKSYSVIDLLVALLKSKIKIIFIYIFYRIRLFTIFGTDITTGIPYSLFHKNIELVPLNPIKRKLPHSLNRKSILYVNPLESEFLKCVDVDHYKNILRDIAGDVLLISKIHPREVNTSILQGLDYIKFENFFSDEILSNTRLAIGVSSTMLIELALFDHIKVISVIELLKWYSSKEKYRACQFINSESAKFNVKIYLPCSIMEFHQLCEI
jgi:hypothetical protein